MEEQTEFFKYLKIENNNIVMKIMEIFIEARELEYSMDDLKEIIKTQDIEFHINGFMINKFLIKNKGLYKLNLENGTVKFYIKKFDEMIKGVLV